MDMKLKPMPVTINLKRGDDDLRVQIPAAYAALTKSLPLIMMLFGSKKDPAVSSRDLHAALGVARNHSSWLVPLLKSDKLVQGVDWVQVGLDAANQDDWDEIAANGGSRKTTTYFTPKAAARIAVLTKNEVGESIFNYMYAVTDAATDAVISLYKQQAAMARRDFLEGEKACAIVAKQHGHKTVTGLLMDAHAREKMGRLEGAGHAHEQAALLMWEEASKALKYMKAGKGSSAMMALDNIDLKFGSYSDLIRHEPPWTT